MASLSHLFRGNTNILTEGLCGANFFKVETRPAMEVFRNILQQKKSRLSEQQQDDVNNFTIRIYASPTKDTEPKQHLRAVLGGDTLDDLLDMRSDPKIFTLKLYITILADDEDSENLEIVSKEMSVSINPENDPKGTKYFFEDSDLATLAKPYRGMDHIFYHWVFGIELIADEEVVYCLDIPQLKLMDKGILETGLHADFSFIAGNGAKIPCNKVFLASRSPVFRQMLQTNMIETNTENAYKLEEMTEEGVKALLKYIYYFSVEDALKVPGIAVELLEAGHKYDITSLEKAMKQIILGKSEEWFTLDVAILLFIWSMNMDDYEEVKKKVVQVLKRKWKELQGSSLFDELFLKHPQLFKELLVLTMRGEDQKINVTPTVSS